jgi:hypothetical protein
MSSNTFDEEPGATPGWMAEILELDRDLLINVAGRTQEWGDALTRAAEEAPPGTIPDDASLYEAASLLTIAGSYWMLLDTRRASRVLRRAASLYQLLGDRFAHAVAICGSDSDVAYGALEEGDTALSPSSRAHVMLALGWLESTSPAVQADAREGLAAHAHAAERTATEPVGRIGLPLDAVVRVLKAAEALLYEGAVAMPELHGALHDYLVRSDDIARAARADTFHWRKLLSASFPRNPRVPLWAQSSRQLRWSTVCRTR